MLDEKGRAHWRIYLLTYKIRTYKACKQEEEGHITDIQKYLILSNEDVMGNTHPVHRKKEKEQKGRRVIK